MKEGDTRKESNTVPALHEILFLPHSVHLLFNRMKETDPNDWVYLRRLWERNMQDPTNYSGSCDSSIEVFVLFFPQIFGFMYINLLVAEGPKTEMFKVELLIHVNPVYQFPNFYFAVRMRSSRELSLSTYSSLSFPNSGY